MGGNSVETLDVALEQRVQSIWLSFGTDLAKWVDYIRKYDQNRTTAHKTLIWILVNSVAEAEAATKKLKADVLIVQGKSHTKLYCLVSQSGFFSRNRSWWPRSQ